MELLDPNQGLVTELEYGTFHVKLYSHSGIQGGSPTLQDTCSVDEKKSLSFSQVFCSFCLCSVDLITHLEGYHGSGFIDTF